MSEPDDDMLDDDVAMEEWMAKTDSQQQAEIERWWPVIKAAGIKGE